MKQIIFEQQRRPRWQQFEQQLANSDPKEAHFDLPSEYRYICQSLSLAKTRGYSPQLIGYLNQLMLQGHGQLYQGRGISIRRMVFFLLDEFPILVRQCWPTVLAAHLLFYGPALVCYLLVLFQPHLAYSLSDQASLTDLATMYNPDNEYLGTQRSSAGDWQMFGHYIYNNISIAFKTFSSGLVATLGSVYFLWLNGVVLGVAAAHLEQLGFDPQFYSFVIAHGAFELTAIVLAGAAGLELGLALLSPGDLSRSYALKRAAAKSIQIVLGVIAMLIIAAFVEAFWSSSTQFPILVKYLTGAGCWLFVGLYFIFVGRRHEPS